MKKTVRIAEQNLEKNAKIVGDNVDNDGSDRYQKAIKCKVKIYKISPNMQRCPYIHEMKERLLGEQQMGMEQTPVKKIPTPPPFQMEQQQQQQPNYNHHHQPVATIVKLNSDGYGSHTSPTHHRADRTPLMPKEPEDDFEYVETSIRPKNAKTSLFIIMSFVYAKLLIVVCIAYVISDVVTHNIPLYYYEGFFTYLYGMSILFLLYVFCFLLQESACCGDSEQTPKKEKIKKPPKERTKEKEKELKKEEERKKKEEERKKKEEKERLKKEKKEKEKEKEKEKDKEKKKDKKQEKEQSTPAAPPPPTTTSPPPQQTATAPPTTNSADVEAGVICKAKRKRKTTQNDQSHGSFFLRIGAIAFGLGTMIYNGLEFGTFFEVPFTSACYMILRGVNPVLQMIFTFMQMYFIFMNSRLNIHRFKVVARFGLMHVVATNICVWIRTLVLEYLKEITVYHKKMFNVTDASRFAESIRLHNLRNANTVLGSHVPIPDVIKTTPALTTITTSTTTTPATTLPTVATTLRNLIRTTTTTAASRLNNIVTTLPTMTSTKRVFASPPARSNPTPRLFYTTPSTTPTTTVRLWRTFTTSLATTTSSTTSTTTTTSSPSRSFFDFRNFNNFDANNIVNVAEDSLNAINGSEFFEDLAPQALRAFNTTTTTILPNTTTAYPLSCERNNIMGTIVQDSAPYLYPFIIEYSLIGAAVIYVMWKHIGRNPRYVTQEDLEHRLEVMLSRRAVAMAQAQQGRVDCVGASKGLFFGLLLLVGSLICLILFFVLIHHPDFGLLAIYLADVSHCVLMVLSIIAIIIGFIRVQSLKFKTEDQSDLNDILLRVSAFGLFIYAVFSVIAGHLDAFTKEPNLLVMITGTLSVLQVILQLLFIADVSRRRVHLPEHDRSKPGRQVVTFLLICNVTMWIIYTFEMQKVEANPVQLEFYGFLAWAFVQRITLPLCIFHRFHSAVTLAEIWKTSYKARLE